MPIRKRGEAFHYDFTIEGTRFRGSCDTGDKRLAEAIEARERLKVFEQIKLGIRPGITLDEIALIEWQESSGQLAIAKNVKGQTAVLIDLLGQHTAMHSLTDHDIGRLVSRLKARKTMRKTLMSNATANRYLTRLGVLNNTARRKGYAYSPVEFTAHMLPEPPAQENVLSVEEMEQLLAAEPLYLSDPVEFALLTGLRLANIEALQIRQVNFAAPSVTMVAKGGKMHTSPLLPRAVEILEKNIGRRKEGFVFLNDRQRRLGAFRVAWQKKKLAAGLPTSFRFHDLRHTFASWCVAHGMPLPLLRELMGHSDIETTMRYAHYKQDAATRFLHDTLGHKFVTRGRAAGGK